MDKPIIVCYCGSLERADAAFLQAEYKSAKAGQIALFPARVKVIQNTSQQPPIPIEYLKILHKRKIDIADKVVILNVGGYIGSDTQEEIEYALSIGKPVEYLEKEATHV